MGRPIKNSSYAGVLRVGKGFAASALGKEYVVKLDRLARKWGCETLGEAAIELLKDAIDEELRKERG